MMSTGSAALIEANMDEQSRISLASSLTRAGSTHSYYTIRWLVDGDLVNDALDAYAYFRWVDDVIDASDLPRHERLAFVARERSLMERLYAGELPGRLSSEEQLLVDLILHERRGHTGLRSYLSNMMGVMSFDARRRGRVISRGELRDYTDTLTTAVMDGLSYFIGHEYAYPQTPQRYLAVAGAHVCHMLRDAVEDSKVGYYNIPREVLEVAHISPTDVAAPAYRDWVAGRVMLARKCLRAGKRYILGLRHARAVLAGLAYCTRFERVLDVIERDGFRLRSDYHRDRTFTPKAKARRISPSPIPSTRSPVVGVG
jgi:phytoene/squalene synthetase